MSNGHYVVTAASAEALAVIRDDARMKRMLKLIPELVRAGCTLSYERDDDQVAAPASNVPASKVRAGELPPGIKSSERVVAVPAKKRSYRRRNGKAPTDTLPASGSVRGDLDHEIQAGGGKFQAGETVYLKWMALDEQSKMHLSQHRLTKGVIEQIEPGEGQGKRPRIGVRLNSDPELTWLPSTMWSRFAISE